MTAAETTWGQVARTVDEVADLRAEVATLRKLVAVIGERHRKAELLYRAARDAAWTSRQEADRLRRENERLLGDKEADQ